VRLPSATHLVIMHEDLAVIERAEQAVLSRAVQEHHAVILGEEHPHPEHRAFGARLIQRLREHGITHLAIETNAQALLDAAARSGRIAPSTELFAFAK